MDISSIFDISAAGMNLERQRLEVSALNLANANTTHGANGLPFTPLQVAAIAALEGDQACVGEIAAKYQARRDVLHKGLTEIGWDVELPRASMYIWARIPPRYRELGSLEFAKRLLDKAKVCVSPGIGFGDHGDDYVRFALIENESRTRQAVRGIKAMFKADGLLKA